MHTYLLHIMLQNLLNLASNGQGWLCQILLCQDFWRTNCFVDTHHQSWHNLAHAWSCMMQSYAQQLKEGWGSKAEAFLKLFIFTVTFWLRSSPFNEATNWTINPAQNTCVLPIDPYYGLPFPCTIISAGPDNQKIPCLACIGNHEWFEPYHIFQLFQICSGISLTTSS